MLLIGSIAIFFSRAGQTQAQAGPEPERLRVEVLNSYPHATDAYTQGLLLYEGFFYESTGNTGESTLRRVVPETGEVVQQFLVANPYFAEGLALVDDRLIQLTWTSEVAFVYDRETFRLVEMFRYEGEGWGLCYDGEHLWMSDGSEVIVRRDAETFEVTSQIQVLNAGQPVTRLNELECVGDDIYANVWFTDEIVRIDKSTGLVEAVIDASGLLTEEERSTLATHGVLNGIAYDEEQDVFFITGKWWPRLFEVRFVPDEQDSAATPEATADTAP